FALSSLREGLPNVVLEAMALETAVVATRVAGIPRLIQSGENGILVDPGDVGGLARALEELALDDQRRRTLGQASRVTVQSRFSFKERMHKVKTLYDGLLSSPGNGRLSGDRRFGFQPDCRINNQSGQVGNRTFKRLDTM